MQVNGEKDEVSWGKILKQGAAKGIKTTWFLVKTIIPVYVLVTVLKHTPLLSMMAAFLAPCMQIFGLSGTASLPLVLGLVLNLYAALGAMISLPLSPSEITTLAIMLLLAHNLPVEIAVARRSGASATFLLILRCLLAVLVGVALGYYYRH